MSEQLDLASRRLNFGISILVLAIGLFSSTPAFSAWVQFYKSNDGSVDYYDSERIKRQGNLGTIWLMNAHVAVEGSMTMRLEFDCKGETVRITHAYGHTPENSGGGETTGSKIAEPKLVVPGSRYDFLMKKACK